MMPLLILLSTGLSRRISSIGPLIPALSCRLPRVFVVRLFLAIQDLPFPPGNNNVAVGWRFPRFPSPDLVLAAARSGLLVLTLLILVAVSLLMHRQPG